MLSKLRMYRRDIANVLNSRLNEDRKFIQVVFGSRQVGKTTLVTQAIENSTVPCHYGSADGPTLRTLAWIEEQWEFCRLTMKDGGVLILDEIQKIPGWSELVKALWDEDTLRRRPLKVVLLGSSSLLMGRGLGESLAGRFEIIYVPHWSFKEMKDAFGWDVETYVFYGGYPGAANLIGEPERWRRYIIDSLIETVLSRDILLVSRVEKPALLRQLFYLGCHYSGQILSYQKMSGQLQDAGNVTTLSYYLDLLKKAGLLKGIPKFFGSEVRRRGSTPKLMVFNMALMSALSELSFDEVRMDRSRWGRWVESAVGSHLLNLAWKKGWKVFYWSMSNAEVDFILSNGHQKIAFEVKSGKVRGVLSGMKLLEKQFGKMQKIVVGSEGFPLEDFFQMDWFQEGDQ